MRNRYRREIEERESKGEEKKEQQQRLQPDEVPEEQQRENAKEKPQDEEEKESPFDCNICLSLPKDPIVTTCGHVFCWVNAPPCVEKGAYLFIAFPAGLHLQVD